MVQVKVPTLVCSEASGVHETVSSAGFPVPEPVCRQRLSALRITKEGVWETGVGHRNVSPQGDGRKEQVLAPHQHGSVTETPHSQCKGPRFDPWSGN